MLKEELFRSLGIDTEEKTIDQCIEELASKYNQVCEALEYTELERFKAEIKRIKKPTN